MTQKFETESISILKIVFQFFLRYVVPFSLAGTLLWLILMPRGTQLDKMIDEHIKSCEECDYRFDVIQGWTYKQGCQTLENLQRRKYR